MLLKPRNLEEFVGQLKALPEEKRKVVVLVGRHPNEGTINIAVRHHKEWEEHGAVAVRIPGDWTPHGAWHKAFKLLKEKKLKKKPDDLAKLFAVPIDTTLVDALGENFPVFVNLHGSTFGSMSPSNLTHLLDVGFTTRAPDFIKTAASVSHDERISITETPYHLLQSYSGEPRVQNHHIIVEFVYRAPYRRLQSKKARQIARIQKAMIRQSIRTPGQLNSKYLEGRFITREALDAFSKNFHPWFNNFLKKLAKGNRK